MEGAGIMANCFECFNLKVDRNEYGEYETDCRWHYYVTDKKECKRFIKCMSHNEIVERAKMGKE